MGARLFGGCECPISRTCHGIVQKAVNRPTGCFRVARHPPTIGGEPRGSIAFQVSPLAHSPLFRVKQSLSSAIRGKHNHQRGGGRVYVPDLVRCRETDGDCISADEADHYACLRLERMAL